MADVKEINADKAYIVFKDLIKVKDRLQDLKQRYTEAASPEEKAYLIKHAHANKEQLDFATKELAKLKETTPTGLGKVFRSFAEKYISENGADAAKAAFKRIGPHIPGAGALAGIMTAFSTGDASAAVPVLNEAENVGPEKGTPEYAMESGEQVSMPKEDVHAQAEAIKAMQKENTTVKEPQYSSPVVEQQPEVPVAAEGAIMNDEKSNQVLKGIKTEKEHTPKSKVALKIALDHLKEDPRYYDHLASMEMENPKVAENEEVKATGGVIDGDENQHSGDTIVARLNKDELVLNVEQQQNAINRLNGKNPEHSKGKRVDDSLDDKELDVNSNAQEELFAYLKGESNKKPTQDIIVKKFAEGTPNAGAAPTIPSSMQYTGPDATTQGTLPLPEKNAEDLVSTLDAQTPVAPAPVMSAGPSTTPIAATPVVPVAPAQKDKVIENNQKQAEAESSLKASVAQEAAIKAQQSVKGEISKAEADDAHIMENARQDLLKEDGAMKEEHQTAAGKFFSSANFAEKILMGAALALSIPVMIVTGKNPALDYMLNSVESDLAQQKLKTDQYLAKKNYYLDLQKQAINKQAQATSSEQAKTNALHTIAQIDAIKADIGTQRAKLKLDQARGAREQGEFDLKLRASKDQQATMQAAAPGGKIQDISVFPQAVQDKSIRMPDGSYSLAMDKTRARKVTEYQNEVIPALQSINKIREMGKEGMALPFTERAAQVDTEMQALIGNLRLPITGPGILTDSERSMLKGIIGNPTKVFSIRKVEEAKLDQIEAKLRAAMKAQYENAGVSIPKTKNDANVETLIKNNKGLTEAQAIRALRKTGRWTE